MVGTAGDTVTLDAGWINGGQETVNGADFVVYNHADLGATLNVDIDVSVVAA